jgi:predicted lipid carrier protein YhbT
MNKRIPKFQLPHFAALLGQRLPQWPNALALAGALNAALKLKLFSTEDTALLEGKTFQIIVRDAGFTVNTAFRGGLFHVVFNPSQAPDLVFSANLSVYLQLLARQEDPDTLFFNRELEITGDTELGLVVKNMLDAVDWSMFQAQNLRNLLPRFLVPRPDFG